MSTAESWFEVQTAQAEENALVADLVERSEQLIAHDLPVLLAAYERVLALRQAQGKHMTHRTTNNLERITEMLSEARNVIKEAGQ